jgi:hypothetical protein
MAFLLCGSNMLRVISIFGYFEAETIGQWQVMSGRRKKNGSNTTRGIVGHRK